MRNTLSDKNNKYSQKETSVRIKLCTQKLKKGVFPTSFVVRKGSLPSPTKIVLLLQPQSLSKKQKGSVI